MKAEKKLDLFLGKVRRRMLLNGLLRSCFWSVAANEVWRWGTVGVNLLFGKEFPVYSIGLYIFTIMAVRLFVSGRGYAAAREADRRMRMKDRFISYLDFHDRKDVEAVFRKAQAEEAVSAIKAGDLRKNFRIHPLLWGAPVLFMAMIFFNYADPFLSEGPFYYLQKPAPRFTQGTDDGEVALDRDKSFHALFGNTLSNKKGRNNRSNEPEISRSVQNSGETLMVEPVDSGKNSHGITSKDKLPHARQLAGPPSSENLLNRGPWEDHEPVRIYSETIGTELKRVVDRKGPVEGGKSEGALDGSMVVRGKVAFDLVPENKGELSMDSGGANSFNSGKGRFEVVVDFDGILPMYRDYVKRYFEQLGEVQDAGNTGS